MVHADLKVFKLRVKLNIFRWRRIVVVVMVPLGMILIQAAFRYWGMPRCVVYNLTGISCPGCGTYRSIQCFLTGDMQGAWLYNPIWIATSPFIFVAILRTLQVTHGHLANVRNYLWVCLLLIILVFTVCRNIHTFVYLPEDSIAGDEKTCVSYRDK